MAFVILNNNRSFCFVSASNEDIDSCIGTRGCLETGNCGYKVTISEDDFNSIRLYEKSFVSSDGSTVVLEDHNVSFANQAELDKEIERKIDYFKSRKDHKSSGFKTRMDNMITALSDIDTSSISYPLNKSIEKYLDEQGTTVLSDLQF